MEVCSSQSGTREKALLVAGLLAVLLLLLLLLGAVPGEVEAVLAGAGAEVPACSALPPVRRTMGTSPRTLVCSGTPSALRVTVRAAVGGFNRRGRLLRVPPLLLLLLLLLLPAVKAVSVGPRE